MRIGLRKTLYHLDFNDLTKNLLLFIKMSTRARNKNSNIAQPLSFFYWKRAVQNDDDQLKISLFFQKKRSRDLEDTWKVCKVVAGKNTRKWGRYKIQCDAVRLMNKAILLIWVDVLKIVCVLFIWYSLMRIVGHDEKRSSNSSNFMFFLSLVCTALRRL